jgi:hypothetical protein
MPRNLSFEVGIAERPIILHPIGASISSAKSITSLLAAADITPPPQYI